MKSLHEMTDREAGETIIYGFIFVSMVLLFTGAAFGYWLAPPVPTCPEPQYDVNRVVKMHEEARQCAVELEEARDNVLVCGRLLKRALE